MWTFSACGTADRAFYGARADSPPSWIFDDTGAAVVHLLGVDAADPEGSYAKMSQFRGGADTMDPPSFRGSGAIDHIAFQCENYDEVLARLKSRKIPCAENDLSRFGLRQIFVKDPNGITLELNFQVAVAAS